MTIESRMPRKDYDAIQAVNITRLKELRRSPQHYQWALTHRKESPAMTVGIATHVAVLEPERFVRDFAIWERRTDAGAMAPRKGQYWDEFTTLHLGKTVLTRDEGLLAKNIAKAVRSDPLAMPYLESGEPEVTLEWEIDSRQCKGRVDWLTYSNFKQTIVGLKTARDCRHMIFGSQAAKLGYHLQWAFYHDAMQKLTGVAPPVIEIVVESEPPHAVAVYRIPNDVLDQGRDEYERLLAVLRECEDSGIWPGPNTFIEDLTLPTWAYDRLEDDIGDLGLES